MNGCPYTPPHPKPVPDGEKRTLWKWIQRTRKSSLHTLYEGSFRNWLTVLKLPGGHRLVMPKDPADIRKVLVDKAPDFPKSEAMHIALKPLLGESIFTTNGEVWERQRRMLDPAFAQSGLKKVFPLMLDAVEDLRLRLEAYGDTESCPIGDEMTHVTADIIMRTILSYPLSAGEAHNLAAQFEKFQRKASQVNLMKILHLPPWMVPWDWVIWRFQGWRIRNLLGKIISSRFREYQTGTGGEYGDILEGLMSAVDPVTKTPFSEKELIDQIVMLFLAGHETSASVLGWTFHILANQPDYAEAIRREAEETCPDFTKVKFSEVARLKTTRAVFREVLRLYPPVAFFSRSSAGDEEFHGCPVRSGDLVNLSPYVVQRHTELWEDPDVFRPERFMGGANGRNDSGRYFPFSTGPRICIGAAFAQQEAHLIIARVCQLFEIEPVQGLVPEPVSRLTLRSENGISVKLKKRSC
ncbi:MAG: cytochrome P450 [Verrucomicrobiales bacterium]|nr:cytochrome P450 [Verrucomicrobiales bacterium]